MADFGSQSIALVVDDNPESLGMVSVALEDQGLTVLVARDGNAAIQLTKRVQPDVILMDAVMPELDGFETCRRLKTGPNPTLAPIIFMTGLTEQEHVVKGLQAGGVDYITKPVVIEELLARMTTHVLNSRLIQSARQAIDASDHLVLAFDMNGALKWGSGKAIQETQNGTVNLTSGPFRMWLNTCTSNPASSVELFEDGEATLQFIGYSDAKEILVKLIVHQSGSKEDRLQAAFGLTARESEVLYWLTLGKTNRDISAILSLSARTVNKHLEQVFQKMGVDNRTSAAVLADRQLNT